MTLLTPARQDSPAPIGALIPEARRRGRRRLRRRLAVVVAGALVVGGGALAALAALGTGAPRANAPTAALTASSPRVSTCSGAAVTGPVTLTLSCADANSALTRTTWRSWGTDSATGVTTFAVNLCAPDCAASPISYFPGATVVLDRPVTTGHGARFSRATVTYRAGGATHRVVQDLSTGGRA
jgi:hypothetical protein